MTEPIKPVSTPGTQEAEVYEEEVEGCFQGNKNISITTSWSIREATVKAEEAADGLRAMCKGKGLIPQVETGNPATSPSSNGGMCTKIKVSVTCVAAQPKSAPQEGETKPAPIPTPSASPAPTVPPKLKEEPPPPAETRPANTPNDKEIAWQKLKPSERAKAIRDAVVDRLNEDNADAVTEYVIAAVRQNLPYDEGVKRVNDQIDKLEGEVENDMERTVTKPAQKAVEKYNRRK